LWQHGFCIGSASENASAVSPPGDGLKRLSRFNDHIGTAPAIACDHQREENECKSQNIGKDCSNETELQRHDGLILPEHA
jgi:hypothetical protein